MREEERKEREERKGGRHRKERAYEAGGGGMKKGRKRRGEREIAGLISRLGCLAMDVDTRHLLERAATAGYQSSGSPRS